MTLPCPTMQSQITAILTGCPSPSANVGDLIEFTASATGAGTNLTYQYERLSPNPAIFPVTTNPIFSFTANANNVGDTLSFMVTVCDVDTGICDTTEPCTFVIAEECTGTFDCAASEASFTLSPNDPQLVVGTTYTISELLWIDCEGNRANPTDLQPFRFYMNGVEYTSTFQGVSGAGDIYNNYTFTLPAGTPSGSGQFAWGDDSGVNPSDLCTMPFDVVTQAANFLSGCPIDPITTTTQIDLEIMQNPLGVDARYSLKEVSPNAQTVLSDVTATDINDYIFTLSNPGQYLFEIECCEGVQQLDKIQQILQQRQPVTGMLSRTGWGENATGGTNLVFVSTMDDLKAAAAQGGNFICLDPSFGQQTMDGSTIAVAGDTGITGLDAPGHSILSSGTEVQTFSIRGGNVVLHCLKSDADPATSRTFLRTRPGGLNFDFWYDHIEITGYRNDDAINLGGSTSTDHSDRLTVSNCKTSDDCFAAFATYLYQKDHDAGAIGRTTAHNNYWRSIFRMARYDTMTFAHQFNNYIEEPRDSATGIRNRYYPGFTSSLWVENDHFVVNAQSPAVLQQAFQSAIEVGPTRLYDSGTLLNGTPIQGQILVGSGNTAQRNVTNLGDPGYVAPSFPYSYTLLDAQDVPATVSAFAGADFDKADVLTEGQCISQFCAVTVA